MSTPDCIKVTIFEKHIRSYRISTFPGFTRPPEQYISTANTNVFKKLFTHRKFMDRNLQPHSLLLYIAILPCSFGPGGVKWQSRLDVALSIGYPFTIQLIRAGQHAATTLDTPG